VDRLSSKDCCKIMRGPLSFFEAGRKTGSKTF
jgi:hypothetical protein